MSKVGVRNPSRKFWTKPCLSNNTTSNQKGPLKKLGLAMTTNKGISQGQMPRQRLKIASILTSKVNSMLVHSSLILTLELDFEVKFG